MNQPLILFNMNNPVFESMIKVLKTYAGKKVFPEENERSAWMKERWALQKYQGQHRGHIQKVIYTKLGM